MRTRLPGRIFICKRVVLIVIRAVSFRSAPDCPKTKECIKTLSTKYFEKDFTNIGP